MSIKKHIKTFAWAASILLVCAAFYRANTTSSNEPPDLFPSGNNFAPPASQGKAALPIANTDGQATDRHTPPTAQAPNHPLLRSDKNLESLSVDDIATLQNLPAICISDLPGLPAEEAADCPATEEISKLPAYTAMKAEQASGTTPTNLEPKKQSEFATVYEKPVEEAPNALAATAVFDMPSTALSSSSNPSSSSNSKGNDIELASWTEEDFASYNPHAKASAKRRNAARLASNTNGSGLKPNAKQELAALETDPHLEAFSRTAYPSAVECAKCHEQIFEEWASSSHAYASISPMFHVFEDRINKLSSGTIGYFCMRCHAPVATTMGLRRDQPIWDGPRVFREGVTCVACHRVKTPYGKVNGERHMIPGGPEAPVVGGSDGMGVHLAAEKYADYFKTKTDPDSKKPGQVIHRRSIQFEELSKSSYCVSCHQVAVEPGIKLEVVWDQYRASPAYREGVTCQACHMGAIPGVDSGYTYGPAAIVDGKAVNPERKHSNHIFYGPGYSIAHPGLFPHDVKADAWSFNEWLAFDWRAGWGTKKFEDHVAKYPGSYFPPPWDNIDARMDAREIVDRNLKKLEYKHDLRIQVLENGSKLDGPFFADTPRLNEPLSFRYCLTNINPGHNMPSGSLGAQPQIWMNTVLTGPNGQRIWESGYLDSNGDLCDNHSLDVLARKAPFDTQLMNLQTKFFTTNVKGTDREMYLPVPFDQDQLPFLRPSPQPVTVINHPVGIRMEGHSLPPLGSRNVKYSVPSRLMTQPGTYTLSVRLRSRAEPIYFMRFCGATTEMIRSMNEWIADFHEQTVVFEIH
jgi:hypothetical protein